MNINDFDEPLPPGDMLYIIFFKQAELRRKYHEIEEKNLGYPITAGTLNLDDPKDQQRIKDFMERITEEIFEAANCLKCKPWKNTHVPTDKAHFYEELVDALHFFIELLIMVGFTPESLTKTYLNKNAVNHFRIGSNY